MIFELNVRKNDEKETFAFSDCHEAKSIAGSMFYHDENVEQVAVTDSLGKTYLFLDKLTNERISVPSEESLTSLISVF